MIIDETSLISGCRKGDRAYQKALYDRFAPKMLGVCLRYTNNMEIARDLLQDGFIKVFTNFTSYKGTGSLEGWLRKIFVNTALEYLRKMDILRDSTDLKNIEQSAYVEADEVMLNELTEEELVAIINELPVGYRMVFNLFAIEGYSHKEIADLLGINESTSRSQYIRARQALQKKLAWVVNDKK